MYRKLCLEPPSVVGTCECTQLHLSADGDEADSGKVNQACRKRQIKFDAPLQTVHAEAVMALGFCVKSLDDTRFYSPDEIFTRAEKMAATGLAQNYMVIHHAPWWVTTDAEINIPSSAC